MRFRLLTPLVAAFAAVVTVQAVGQVLAMNRGLRDEFLSLFQRELARELELAPLIVRGLDTTEPDSAARVFSQEVGYPVTILQPDGRIVGASSDLPFQTRGLVVQLETPDIQGALAGYASFAERRGVGEVEVRLFGTVPVSLGDRDLLLQVAAPLDEIDLAVRGRVVSTLLQALPAFLLAVLLATLLALAIRRPVSAVARQARGMGGGDLSRRIRQRARIHELDELAGTVNRLADDLQSRVQTLTGERDEMQTIIDCMGEAVVALTEDARVLRTNHAARELLNFPDPVDFAPIGALVRQPALRELMETAVIRPVSARDLVLGDRHLLVSSRLVEGGGAMVTFLDVTEIRRLEMVRRDFVANASHELKTPLTVMRGYAEALLEDAPPEDTKREFLGSIRSNSLRLQRLIDDLLDLSRLESGGWRAKVEEVDVSALAREVWAELAEGLDQRGMGFEVVGEALVRADEQGLVQILKNLLENAVRYTPEDGRIQVRISTEGEQALVSVSDSGSGIPSSDLPRIFERFYRVDPARSRAEGGTGLGLAIVRHLVHAMGGDVAASSELGQGTTITFSLPLVGGGS